MNCAECGRHCCRKSRPRDYELFGVFCDCCKGAYCKTCAGLTTTEAHALALTQRKILYFCLACRQLRCNSSELSERVGECGDALVSNLEASYQQTMEDLQERIAVLSAENKDRENYIKGLKRRTQDFEDSVYTAEKDFLDTIDRQKADLDRLNIETASLLKQNSDLLEQVIELESKLKSLTREVNECNIVRDNMLTTIETLTEDNRSLVEQWKTTSHKAFMLGEELHSLKSGSSHLVNKTDVDATGVITLDKESVTRNPCGSSKLPQPRRILVLCDQTGRGIAEAITRHLGSEYQVQCIIKPGAFYADVVDSLEGLVSEFNKRDCVVFMAGANDFEMGRFPRVKDIWCKMKTSTHTNLIFLSTPCTGRRNLLRTMRFNTRFSCFLERIDRVSDGTVAFINSASKSGFKLRNAKIARLVVALLEADRVLFKSLHYIETNCEAVCVTQTAGGLSDENQSKEMVESLDSTLSPGKNLTRGPLSRPFLD